MRVKRGVTARKRHNKIRKATKGMSHAHTSSIRRGKQEVVRALVYSYRDRRNKKRSFRSLWNIRINAAARQNGTSYSKLIAGLKNSNIQINRKVLAQLAIEEPKAFSKITSTIKK